jgi:hypothetical protein
VRISTDGGCQPRWRADGKELFYLSGERLMAVAIDAASSLKPVLPAPLFAAHVGRNSELTWDYVARPDGQRFLLKELVFDQDGSPMVVVLNWQRLLRR